MSSPNSQNTGLLVGIVPPIADKSAPLCAAKLPRRNRNGAFHCLVCGAKIGNDRDAVCSDACRVAAKPYLAIKINADFIGQGEVAMAYSTCTETELEQQEAAQ